MSHVALTPRQLASVMELAQSSFHKVSVNDLADVAGYSPFHFSRLFREALRVPPGQFLTALRIDAAKRRLMASDDPVIDVATSVGFDSLSSFSRRFRQAVGTPPAALRRLVLQVEDRPLEAFRLEDVRQQQVVVQLELPADIRPAPEVRIWVGWYPTPVPVGLPSSGVLVDHAQDVALRLSPGNPWLLGFAVAAYAAPDQHIAPTEPIVARCDRPLFKPAQVTLHFSCAEQPRMPLLSALPCLRDAARSDKPRRC